MDLSFSYKKLATFHFDVLACEIGVGTDAEPEALALPPDVPLHAGLTGYVIRGCPSSAKRPLLQWREGFVIYTPVFYQRHFVDLRQSFADYEQQFRAKTRSGIKRKIKKFAQSAGGKIDFRIYCTADEIDEFFDVALDISKNTYQDRLLDAGLPDDDDYRATIMSLAETDAIRGFLLFKNGEPVSYLLLVAQNDVLLYKYLGYAPAYTKWSPGVVLHWLALQHLFSEQKFALLDFTEGEGQQKRTFGTGSVGCVNVFCLRATAKNVLAVSLHIVSNRLSDSAGRIAQSLGLKTALKKLIKRSA